MLPSEKISRKSAKEMKTNGKKFLEAKENFRIRCKQKKRPK